MDTRFDTISMNGRMAYVIMCVEKYLKSIYPNKDWTLLAEKLWSATSMNWGDWTEIYSSYIPDVLFQYDNYDEELSFGMTPSEYTKIKKIYAGITEGLEDNPEDEVNFILNKPFEIATVYEGTTIGNGSASLDIINATEALLINHTISLPDYHSVEFSKFTECNGWGDDFDGKKLSIILN